MGDYCDEEEFWDLTGIQAMKMVAEFLEQHPKASEADIVAEPEDGMFISLVERKENGDKDWMSAYCMNREP